MNRKQRHTSFINRRSFLERAGVGVFAASSLVDNAGASSQPPGGETKRPPEDRLGIQRCVTEWSYTSGKMYADPFNDVELDVLFEDPNGAEYRVPAFWAGEQEWRVRFAPPLPGRYVYRTVSTDTSNPDLHGRSGTLDVSPYNGGEPLRRRGPIRVDRTQRHFEHEDGTPFFWLGDTCWMGLCHRLRWPEDFRQLMIDRKAKGFSVIQIVAGLYPDMPPFDPRGANEAGYPWEQDYTRINPQYFDMADLRIEYLVDLGLVPCIVGCWGFFLKFMGIRKIQQHWRYIIARWGSLPVLWCLAGEGTMPYYLSTTKAEDSALQKKGWTEVGRYVRRIDPYHHPVTIHPSSAARDTVEDPAVLDFDMLQTGHGGSRSIPNTITVLTRELARTPRMPVLVGEVCYEGILDASRQQVERFMVWTCLLSGAAGHTYGANGIWQLNTLEHPFGPSPHGRCWGGPPWNVAMNLPGSEQVAICKQLFMRYEWWRFEPHPEWVEPHWTADVSHKHKLTEPEDGFEFPYAAGIPHEVRVVFMMPMWDPPAIVNLEHEERYTAYFFDPRTGEQRPLGDVKADVTGRWQIPILPTLEEWVVVLGNQK